MSVGTPPGGITADVVVVSDFNELTKLGRNGVQGKIGDDSLLVGNIRFLRGEGVALDRHQVAIDQGEQSAQTVVGVEDMIPPVGVRASRRLRGVSEKRGWTAQAHPTPSPTMRTGESARRCRERDRSGLGALVLKRRGAERRDGTGRAPGAARS